MKGLDPFWTHVVSGDGSEVQSGSCGLMWVHRVVLGVPPEALVLPAAVRGADPVQRGRGLVRVHLLQHPPRPVAVRRLHPAG